MRKIITYAAAALAIVLAVASCAKKESTRTYDSAKRYFDAWMHLNYPDCVMNEDGIYIIEDIAGDGELLDSCDYAMMSYTSWTLSGTVDQSTEAKWAKQLGSYDQTYYYGDHVWVISEGTQTAGVEAALKGMRIGGERTVIIPQWLFTTNRFDTIDEYISGKNGGSTDYIYNFKVSDATDSIYLWQMDTMDRYIEKVYGKDKVKKSERGFRYITTQEPTDTTSFPSDTTFYINYTGRLLNGQVFDTTIKDTAKVYNIYKSSKDYAPVKITWASEYSDIQLSGSTTITGFAYTLWQMRAYEKGTGVFYSEMGYSTSGSGNAIPEYAPLVFEIEIVDEPED